MIDHLRKFENLHITLWLVKDTCWVLEYKTLGMLMIVPTLFLAVYITWKSRKHHAELFHNIAVCFWICANTSWMIGEFFFNDSLRPIATLFFLSGLGIIAVYYSLLLMKRKRPAINNREASPVPVTQH